MPSTAFAHMNMTQRADSSGCADVIFFIRNNRPGIYLAFSKEQNKKDTRKQNKVDKTNRNRKCDTLKEGQMVLV